MFMSRITLAPTVGAADLARIAAADVNADHRLLWTFFPSEAGQRKFLFRRIERNHRPSFLLVSHDAPVSSSHVWVVESKAYEPELRTGDSLRFSLRANPVVRRRTAEGSQVRHDVVMDAKRRLREQTGKLGRSMATLAEEAGLGWLEARAERFGFAAAPNGIVCSGYRLHRIRRRDRVIAFSSLDFDGLLRVTEPKVLTDTLFRGVGPSKAFGCGLLLVKRP